MPHFLFIFFPIFIITRHDVNDDRYIEFAKDPQFESFVSFRDGTGTLISEEWILTAKHVANSLAPGDAAFYKSGEYPIQEIVSFPETPSNHADLALVRINNFEIALPHVPLYPQSPRRDDFILIVGNGDTGTGRSGPAKNDRITRAATNRIDRVTRQHIEFVFDGPDSERTTELEGISGPGDSGGPAYIEFNGNLYLAGVSSAQMNHGRESAGKYGVKELYVNVFEFRQWIVNTLEGKRFYSFVYQQSNFQVTTLLGGEILALTKDGQEINPEEFSRYEEIVRQKISESVHRDVETAPEERIPAFVRFIKDLAYQEGITESIQDVAFELSNSHLTINQIRMPPPIHRDALEKYREIFGKPLTESIKFDLD